MEKMTHPTTWLLYSDLWQYKSFRVFSSSINVLFWFSRTATRFSKHFTYSFFFRLHSFAASLKRKREYQVSETLDNMQNWLLTTAKFRSSKKCVLSSERLCQNAYVKNNRKWLLYYFKVELDKETPFSFSE